jgi:hypothetical protein
VAARSKAWYIFRSNTGIMGSNPTRDMDVCVYSVHVSGSGLAASWSIVQGTLPAVLGLRNCSTRKTKRFTDALHSKWGQQGTQEEEEEEEDVRDHVLCPCETIGKIIISYILMFSLITYKIITDLEPKSNCNFLYFLPLEPVKLYDTAYRNCYQNFTLLGT